MLIGLNLMTAQKPIMSVRLCHMSMNRKAAYVGYSFYIQEQLS